MIALEIVLGFVLTVTLLIAAAVGAAAELGRLVTRDDEQRRVETARAPRVRDGVRPAISRKGATTRATLVILLAVLGMSGGASILYAQAPEQCRRECSRDLVACQNGCLGSHNFDDCVDECHAVEEDCLSSCR